MPNPDVRPTGAEPAEFIEARPIAGTPGIALDPIEKRDGIALRLDVQTRLNIARWASEYISGLVEDHNGGPEDVRAIIHALDDRSALTDADGS